MSQEMSKPSATKLPMVRLALVGLVGLTVFTNAIPARLVSAQPPPPEPTDLEEAKKELRQLRTQVQTLRGAVGEIAEIEKLRAGAIARALKAAGIEPGSVVAESPEVARTPTAGPKGSGPARGGSKPSSGPPRRPVAVAPEPTTGQIRGTVTVPPGEPVAYVFIENIRGPAVSGKVKIEQIRKQFVPNWAVVQRGTEIEFPNLDNIYHNVFSLSSGNTFDLGLYNSASKAKSWTFSESGTVDVYCNIHPQMASSVLVVPNRYFTKVSGDGTFELKGIPTGRRKIAAWSPGTRMATDWVEVGAAGAAEIQLKLEPKSPGHKNKVGRPYGSYE